MVTFTLSRATRARMTKIFASFMVLGLVASTVSLVAPLDALATGGGTSCKKIEGSAIGSATSVSTNGVTVAISDWQKKSGSSSEYVGFTWSASGGGVTITVKAGTQTYTTSGVSGTWTSPGSHQKAISSITFCGTPQSGPTCPLVQKSGRTIIDFPNDWNLRSDQDSTRQTGTMSTFLEEGAYNVTLVSYGSDHPGAGSQPQEQWKLEGLSGSSSVFVTQAISDLDDDMKMLSELVQTGLVVGDDVTNVRALHAAPKSAPTANSIQPVCAAFDKVPDETPKECKLIVEKKLKNGTRTVGSTIEYEITVKNAGTGDCTGGGVRIQDLLDPQLEFISETHSSNVTGGYHTLKLYDSTTHSLNYNGDTLKPGEEATITVKVKIKQPAQCGNFEITNTARATARELNSKSDWTKWDNWVTVSVTDQVEYACQLSCPLTPMQGRTIVIFPGDWRLRSDVDAQRSEGPLAIPELPAGVYNVTVASGDTNHPAGSTQPQEQWKLHLLHGNDAVAAETNATTDLPDDQQILAEKINTRLVVSANVNNLVALHAAPKSAPTANSIQPLCVGFDKQPDEPTITLVKKVINDDGGTARIGDFTLKVDSTVIESGKGLPVAPGTYTASETNLPGYEAGTWGGDCDKNGNVTVDYGEDAVCEITNDDLPRPTIKLIKTVINDDGGTLGVNDFSLRVNATNVNSGQTLAVNPGTHTASEVQHPDYDASAWSGDCAADGTVTVDYGDSAVCRITNNDKEAPPQNPTITLVKTVINNDGGSATVADFTLKVNNTQVSSGVPLEVAPGTYTASELNLPNYTAFPWTGDCAANGTVTVNYGENKVCEITNDDDAITTITLIKNVINDDGGTKQVSDFVLKVGATQVTSGAAKFVQPGTYTASEVQIAGYTASAWGGDCAQDGTVTVAYAQHKTCTITNNDIPQEPEPATITLIKHVINDNGRTLGVSDFTLKVNTTTVTSGVPLAVSPGTYVASEVQQPNYTASSWSGDCAANGTVTVAAGQHKVCEITNNDTGGGGGGSPRLTIEKSVTPTFTNPGTAVEYTVVVRNTGNANAINVSMTDVLPQPSFSYTDGTVGPNKTWDLGTMGPGASRTVVFNANVASTAIAGFYTNTATAQASNHGPVSDTAVVEVRTGGVEGEEFFPRLQIEKSVSPTFTTPGGTVVYTIVVRNVGEAVAKNVVLDDTMPSQITESVTGKSTLHWVIGDLAVGQEWSISFNATVKSDTLPAIYRNVAIADADNADPVDDTADVEVRIGEVLGFEEIPETGAFDNAASSLATITLTSLFGFGAMAANMNRRRNLSPELKLSALVRKLK